jgi:hypothetical protein
VKRWPVERNAAGDLRAERERKGLSGRPGVTGRAVNPRRRRILFRHRVILGRGFDSLHPLNRKSSRPPRAWRVPPIIKRGQRSFM